MFQQTGINRRGSLRRIVPGAGSGWLAAVATSVVVVMEWNGMDD